MAKSYCYDPYCVPPDSPVETLRKSLPRGKGDWPGFSHVSRNLSLAAEKMGAARALGDLHVKTMAILGTGHEETMKAHQMILREYGWL